jgi:hypothetical protein
MYQPYPGTAQMPETRRPPAPDSVRNAIRVMYAGAAASLIYAIIFVATLSATKSALERHSPQLTASQLNSMQHLLVILAIVEGLIAAGLWIFIAQACRRGKNWARITGTVFFGLATLDVLGGLTVPQAALVKAFAVIIWLIGLAAVVLLWRGPSSAFFQERQP